jgi:glutamyl-tRNA synthetase
MKAPREGETVIATRCRARDDPQRELDDMVVLRSDGTPVYMLAVVVDDHDMGVTHVIRGDDHLNNAARQQMVYHAMGWEVPVWAHIPLIHGRGRQEAVEAPRRRGVEEWQAMGYPAAAMRNYLARLGWSHGDDEFFTDRTGDGVVRPDGIGRRPRGSTSRSSTTSAASTSRRWTMLHCCMIEAFLAATGAPLPATQQRRRCACDVLPQGPREDLPGTS